MFPKLVFSIVMIISCATSALALSERAESLIGQFSNEESSERSDAVEELVKLNEEGLEERLLGLLGSQDSKVRAASARALGRLRSENAVQPLMRLLGDSNRRVRSSAIFSLGLIGDSRAFESVATLVEDENDRIRDAAVTALGWFDDIRAVEILLEASFSDSSESVRWQAAESLSELVDDLNWSRSADEIDVDRVLALAITAIGDQDEEIRKTAARIMSGFPIAEASTRGIEEAVEALSTAIIDSSTEVRAAAATAMASTGSIEVLPFLGQALNDNERWVRENAIIALGDLGHPNALDWLVFVLEKREAREQMRAADALGKFGAKIGDVRAIPALVQAARTDSNSNVQEAALDSLAELEATEGFDVAEAGLRSSEEDVRSEAALLLGHTNNPSAVPLLIRSLNDIDREVRARSAISLGEHKALQAFDALVVTLTDDDEWVAAMAAMALGAIGDPRAIPHLLDNFDHPEGWVRREAVEAVGLLGSEAELGALTALLSGDDSRLARTAVVAIGTLKSGNSFKTLVSIFEGGNEDLRIAAVRGLAETEDVRITALFTPVLRQGDTNVGKAIVSAIGRSEIDGRLDLLRLAFEFDELREETLPYLAKLGDADALSVLQSRLTDAKNDRQLAAIGRRAYPVASQEGFELFSRLLSSRDVSAARSSAIWLARHGGSEGKNLAAGSLFARHLDVIKALNEN
ncbi:MAG: HEAT repeat domain-containing protein [Aliishimia sp.]